MLTLQSKNLDTAINPSWQSWLLRKGPIDSIEDQSRFSPQRAYMPINDTIFNVIAEISREFDCFATS